VAGTGLALRSAMEPAPNRRAPKVPEPIEFDPFEMDWPWPGMLSEPEPPVEPSRGDLAGETPAESPATPRHDG